jgi:nitroreductase
MDAYECLITRKSFRRFKPDTVSEEQIRMILEAGLSSPSSKNVQPWYLLADTSDRKDLVAQAMEEHEEPSCWNPTHPRKGLLYGIKNTRLESARGMREAPLAIQVFSDHPFSGGIDLIVAHSYDPEHRKQLISYGIEIASLAACAENILLAAHSLGLGAFWNMDPIGISSKIKEIYNQPNRDYFTTISIGFPAEESRTKKRKPKFEILQNID